MQFNESSWISVEPRNHTVFETLLSFLDSASSGPANVQHFAESTVVSLRSVGSSGPSVNQYRFESRVLFAILFTIITQLDPAAAQQDYLIILVTSLRDVPLPTSVVQEIDSRDLDSNMNEDLRKLITVLSDFERDAPLYPRLEERSNYLTSLPERTPWQRPLGQCLTASEWASINAFVARLHHSAPDVLKLDLRGLFAMIEALELPLTSSQLEDVLPAAVCWIIYAGHELRTNNVPYAGYDDTGGSRRLPWSRGSLWNGPHAFNQARWEFWMQRFKDIAERSDVSDTVRLAAFHALEAGS
jgi:hypothetical protein